MASVSKSLVTSYCYTVGPDAPVALSVPSGARVTFHCEDASGGQIKEGRKEEELDKGRLFPVTGVVAVEGVEPGDAVGIELLSIDPLRDVGSTWTRTGLGLLDEVAFHVRDVNLEKLSLAWIGENVDATRSVHVGTAGVLPRNPCLGRDLGWHGGNLDFKRFGVGATLWLAAQTPGGNVFLGDVHAAMGDGEICGTGIEVASTVEVRVATLDGWTPRLPTVTTEDEAWLVGVGDSLEAALSEAAREAIRLVGEKMGCSSDDAYLAVSSLLVVEICQVVNSSTSVAVTLGGGLGQLLGPDVNRDVSCVGDEMR